MIVGAALLPILQGKMLFVHTRNSRYLTHPGGISRSGEEAARALHRGVAEELGVSLNGAYQFGQVHGKTSRGKPLELNLFRATFASTPQLRIGTKELLWLTRREAEHSDMLTKITKEQIFPLLAVCAIW